MDEPRIELLERLEDELERVARAEGARRAERAGLRSRRARVLAVAAALLALVVAGTATAALTGTVTGVPLVDRLVEHSEQLQQTMRELPARLPDRRAVPGSASPSIELGGADGEPRRVSLAYLNRDGGLMSATAEAGRSADAGVGSVGGHAPLGPLLARLGERGVFSAGMQGTGGELLIDGFAAADVTKLELLGPDGAVGAQLTEPWRPDPEQGELRYFVATVHDAAWAKAIAELRAGGRLPPPPSYPFRATYDDGRVVDVAAERTPLAARGGP